MFVCVWYVFCLVRCCVVGAFFGFVCRGEHWLGGLAADLKVNERTIRAWMNDRDALNAQHRIFDDALALCRGRSDQLVQAAAALEGWLKANREDNR